MKNFVILFYCIAGCVIPGCSCLVNSLAFYPDTTNLLPAGSLPGNADEVQITTTDNLKIGALYFHRRHKSNRLVIFFHGNAGNLYHRIDDAEQLFANGVDVLLVSYRGYGRSQGSASEKGVYVDGKSALDYAVKHLAYRPSGIFLYGRSIGSAVAVHAAQHRVLAGVMLITPLTSGSEFAAANIAGCSGCIAGNSFESIKKINSIQAPLLIIHGDADEVIPYAMGKKLYNAYNGPKKMVTITGGGHNDLHMVDSKTYRGAISAFIKQGL